jgi:NhaP-type Na+/H+ or K+/H+ antiporter
VQLTEPSGRDRLRFALTGEGGMNDGTAFPAIMLGIGLMGLHEIGPAGTRWLAVDLGWAVAGGLGIGALFGWSVGKVCLYFRRRHREATGLDDFLAMGLVALSYGAALLCEAYGFLAVFAAGAALRRIELGETFMEEIETDPVLRAPEAAVRPGTAPAYMTRAVLTFNEQLERIGEVVVVVLVGALLGEADWRPATLVFALALFFVIRPAAVVLGLLGEGVPARDLQYMSWFGIRGVGSVYYLFFAINQGMDLETAQGLVGVTVTIIAMSIVAHGVSVTPLMSLYGTGRRRGLRLGGDR